MSTVRLVVHLMLLSCLLPVSVQHDVFDAHFNQSRAVQLRHSVSIQHAADNAGECTNQ